MDENRLMRLACDPEFYRLLSGSFARLTGRRLAGLADAGDAAAQARFLYEDAPCCVLAHNRAADPVFVYANRSAQRCFEYGWQEITRLSSRLSAEAPDRAERQRLLDGVRRHGFIGNYRGMRIAKSGRRFWIENATVWQLVDAAGALHGQAAMFQEWRDVGPDDDPLA